MDAQFNNLVSPMPLVAILRGLTPEKASETGGILIETGFRVIEVPLNSPKPIESISILAAEFGQQALIGAGTVMTTDQIIQVADAGGKLIVSPHSDPNLITTAKKQGLSSLPGVATPSEGFAALNAGADGLKLFPAEVLPPTVVKAWRAVMDKRVGLFPVGGITPNTIEDYWDAGATGFGLGSALYKANYTISQIGANAERFIIKMKSLI
jgi:2-dehydro-3-deoxyphosphogalactonate aldolase